MPNKDESPQLIDISENVDVSGDWLEWIEMSMKTVELTIITPVRVE